ncbi:MAG TPA: hypothetical protein VGG46_03840 [Terriglobales bacterium]
MSAHEILLGYEIGSGKAVHVPFAHTVVCGQTQASGKTTTLEAMLSRSGDPPRPALAFLTKQAESAFAEARRIPPYFKDRADWQFVESILEAMMRERMKYERQWIIRVCQGARSLEQVAANVETALHGGGKKSKPATGYAAGMYLQLSEYFKLLMPELRRLKLDMSQRGTRLELQPGMNVMDLSEYSAEMQSLAIASAMEEVYLRRNVITVIPEAWEFLPQGRNTPVKVAGESLIRKGAAAQNFMWLDSQDISGVDKRILKQVGVWILGVQREANEVEHTLSQMAVPKKLKPPADEVMTLRRGEFFVSFGETLKRVYVLPRWMKEAIGHGIAVDFPRNAARAEATMREAVAKFQPQPSRREENKNVDYKQEWQEAQETIRDNVATIQRLEARIEQLEKDAAMQNRTVPSSRPPYVADKQAVPIADGQEVVLNLDVKKPELNVTVRRFVIEMNDDDSQGRIALLISDGFFDSPMKIANLNEEFRARGWMAQTGRPTPLNLPLAKLAEMGFLRVVGQATYQAVPTMKVNVKEVRTVA